MYPHQLISDSSVAGWQHTNVYGLRLVTLFSEEEKNVGHESGSKIKAAEAWRMEQAKKLLILLDTFISCLSSTKPKRIDCLHDNPCQFSHKFTWKHRRYVWNVTPRYEEITIAMTFRESRHMSEWRADLRVQAAKS